MKTIFIIDDCDTNLITAEKALEDNYNVMTMPSAEMMFSLLEKVTPDLILLDIEMPEMNGFEAIEKLKTGFWYNIPVYFLTGTVNSQIKEKSLKLGAVGVIKKPFSALELLDYINTQLEYEISQRN
jgi:putative two-component system response regulator